MPQFNLQRIKHLIQRDVILRKGTILTAIAVTSVLLLIACFISLKGDYHLSADEFYNAFTVLYIIIGVWLSFSTFREVNQQKSNQFYFTLPASSLERITAAWFSTSILYTLAFTVLGFLIGQMVVLFGSVLFGTKVHLLDMFNSRYLSLVGFYLVTQPIFLYGAVRFRKNGMGKTWLAIAVTILGFMILNMFFCLAFNSGLRGFFAEDDTATRAFELAFKDVRPLGKWLFGIALGPMMLLAAYFRLTEKEV